MSPGARHFARFAQRATPKHSFKAFASMPGPRLGLRANGTPSISALCSQLLPFPPSLKLTSIDINNTTRKKSVSTTPQLHELTTDYAKEAFEDLEALLESSTGRNTVIDFHAR
jgi:hypothetical protein